MKNLKNETQASKVWVTLLYSSSVFIDRTSGVVWCACGLRWCDVLWHDVK